MEELIKMLVMPRQKYAPSVKREGEVPLLRGVTFASQGDSKMHSISRPDVSA